MAYWDRWTPTQHLNQVMQQQLQTFADFISKGRELMASIPKPFARPSVSLSGHSRSWKETTPDNLSEGDMVRDLGLLQAISEDDKTGNFLLQFQSGSTIYLTSETVVVAFTN